MATLFSDDFNRANSTNLGANWSEAAADWSIASNQLVGAAGGSSGVLLTTTTAHADVADCKVSITRITGSGFDGGPLARSNSGGTTFYYLDFYGTNTIELYRRVGGADTLVDSRTQSHTAGDVCKLQVSGTGATVTLKAFRNGVQLGADITDSSGSRITAAGRTGVIAWVDPSELFDDFLAEDLAGGGTTFNINLSGSSTPTGGLTKQVQKKVSGGNTPTGAISKAVGKVFSGATAPAGALSKLVNKVFSGASTPVGTLATLRVILLSLSGSSTPTGTLTKQINKSFSGLSTPVGALSKLVSKFFSGLSTPIGSFLAQLIGIGGGDDEIMIKISVAPVTRIKLTAALVTRIKLTVAPVTQLKLTAAPLTGITLTAKPVTSILLNVQRG